jgi:hypothetical protein
MKKLEKWVWKTGRKREETQKKKAREHYKCYYNVPTPNTTIFKKARKKGGRERQGIETEKREETLLRQLVLVSHICHEQRMC